MQTSTPQEEIHYVWQCGKCGTPNAEFLIFCPVCAAREGLPNDEAATADKTGKLAGMLSGAIEWSLEHGQVKTTEVLAQLVKKGGQAANLAELRNQPTVRLDQLADSYIGANRLGATGSGLTAGLPGGLAAFATIPADISALIYFTMRCVSGVSQSYSFESQGEPGEIITLLAFAQACRMETLIIGQRRQENFDLAAFLLQHPAPYSQAVKNCLLKQLSSYLTVDFAKTSWASFLPIVGGVVNGVDHFWFLGEVGKRARLFYRRLLLSVSPFVELPTATAAAELTAAPLVTVEVPTLRLSLASGPLTADLFYPEQAGADFGLVVVLWNEKAGRELAYRLAESGFGVLYPASKVGPAQLTDLWQYLADQRPAAFPAQLNPRRPGLLAAGEAASLALLALSVSAAKAGPVVLFNPAGPAFAAKIGVPLLVHLAEADPELDPTWPEMLQTTPTGGLLSFNPYPAVQSALPDPASPGYNRQAVHWAWTDSLDWFKRYLLKAPNNQATST